MAFAQWGLSNSIFKGSLPVVFVHWQASSHTNMSIDQKTIIQARHTHRNGFTGSSRLSEVFTATIERLNEVFTPTVARLSEVSTPTANSY